ncbi:MAG: RidA family protein [Peptococcaceae bacterium]|nr:RidA family protein [Peptococcaceae bacterium]
MSYEARLKSMGLLLPGVPQPVAAYVPALQAGRFVYTSGQLPVAEGKVVYAGKVGRELSAEDGYRAARICALNCLAAVKSVAGSLGRIEQIVKLTGFVNSAPDFTGQPFVVNGASELLGEVFGEAGRHARSAVGVAELPLNAAVEIEMIVLLKE